jgi:hypothetical protein
VRPPLKTTGERAAARPDRASRPLVAAPRCRRTRGSTGRSDPLTPPRQLAYYVGKGDFRATGEEFRGHFRDLADLQAEDRVLDIGCGIGRMARALRSGGVRGRRGCPETWVREPLDAHGFDTRWVHGSWRGGSGVSYQDLVVAYRR